MSKKRIAVLFGGQSSEHEVSCISATTVISNIDEELYDILMIGITKEGHWKYVSSIDENEDGSWKESEKAALI